MTERKAGDELKQALDHLKNASDAVVEHLVGEKTVGHLRQAAKHALSAVRSALEKAEKALDEKTAPKNDGGSAAP